MSHAASIEHIQKQVRVYVTVLVALAALTVVTVGISYLHLPIHWAVTVALIVALVKGSLVALYFMHLISEVKTIYWTLALCVVFFAALMFLPAFTVHENVVVPHIFKTVEAGQAHAGSHGAAAAPGSGHGP
jgi:caa(3)-type oxidase subunit IV